MADLPPFETLLESILGPSGNQPNQTNEEMISRTQDLIGQARRQEPIPAYAPPAFAAAVERARAGGQPGADEGAQPPQSFRQSVIQATNAPFQAIGRGLKEIPYAANRLANEYKPGSGEYGDEQVKDAMTAISPVVGAGAGRAAAGAARNELGAAGGRVHPPLQDMVAEMKAANPKAFQETSAEILQKMAQERGLPAGQSAPELEAIADRAAAWRLWRESNASDTELGAFGAIPKKSGPAAPPRTIQDEQMNYIVRQAINTDRPAKEIIREFRANHGEGGVTDPYLIQTISQLRKSPETLRASWADTLKNVKEENLADQVRAGTANPADVKRAGLVKMRGQALDRLNSPTIEDLLIKEYHGGMAPTELADRLQKAMGMPDKGPRVITTSMITSKLRELASKGRVDLVSAGGAATLAGAGGDEARAQEPLDNVDRSKWMEGGGPAQEPQRPLKRPGIEDLWNENSPTLGKDLAQLHDEGSHREIWDRFQSRAAEMIGQGEFNRYHRLQDQFKQFVEEGRNLSDKRIQDIMDRFDAQVRVGKANMQKDIEMKYGPSSKLGGPKNEENTRLNEPAGLEPNDLGPTSNPDEMARRAWDSVRPEKGEPMDRQQIEWLNAIAENRLSPRDYFVFKRRFEKLMRHEEGTP